MVGCNSSWKTISVSKNSQLPTSASETEDTTNEMLENKLDLEGTILAY